MLELEQELAQAEEEVRLTGRNLPIAWGLGFLLDNEELLVKVLRGIGKQNLADQIIGINHETRTGEVL